MCAAYNPHATTRAGVVLPPSPEVRLVPAHALVQPRTWDFPLPERGTWKVTGTAGAGTTSVLIDTVIARLEAGADPSGVLVVASSKESGAALRRELSARLDDYASQSTMVRSVHSLAFALLRHGSEEEIRLITGAEQDAVIRELLDFHAEHGGEGWPDYIRPALGFVGFARQLRDFLLRAIERGLGPDELIELGQRYSRPMWVSAGHFLREYEQVMALGGYHSYSAAELVTQVLLRPELTQSHPWHTIVVDDAQLLTPQAGKLLSHLAHTADLTVVAGDPEQAVFAFRGANADFFDGFRAEHTLELSTSHRRPSPACVTTVASPAELREVVADTIRRRHLEDGVAWKDIAVIVRSTADSAMIRRTLLAAGVPVHINPTDVVLSEQRLVAAMFLAVRALDQPLENSELEELITGPIGGADPVTLRRLIRGLRRYDPQARGVDTLRAVLDGPLPDFGELLTERELTIIEHVRAVLNAGRDALYGGGSIEEVLWAVWAQTGLAQRLQAAALRGGATGSQADRDLDAMMALFDSAGDFSERRPGASLDAFIRHSQEQELPTGVRDRRAAVPDAVPIMSAHSAVGSQFNTVVVVGAQEGTWPSLGETGSLLGQEDLIDILDAGVELSGVASRVSHLSERLEEERRLFHVATTRHTERLLVCAIDAPESDEVHEPSRFIEEFAAKPVNWPNTLARQEAARRMRAGALAQEMGLQPPQTTHPEPTPEADGAKDAASQAPAVSTVERELATELDPLTVSVLSVPALVAQLRRVVCTDLGEQDPDVPQVTQSQQQQAARQLARLAQAGVPGADPQQWWSARSVASSGELDVRAGLSPSRIEALLTCPLNALLSNLAEDEQTPFAMVRGSMAHAFFEAIGRGLDPQRARELTVGAFTEIQSGPAWQQETQRQALETMLSRIEEWVVSTRSAFELIDVEVPVQVHVADGVVLRGFIDRLERAKTAAPAPAANDLDATGGIHIVDLKTGSHLPAIKAAQAHPQLAAYQLALAHGQIQEVEGRTTIITAPDGEEGLPRSGATLVFPAAKGATVPVRDQARLEPEQLEAFAQLLPPLLEEQKGPEVTARTGEACKHCDLKPLCPVQPEGRLVSDE